ncbi:hypothetical protein KUV61_14675 [Nocardioides marinus]|nr:hypothetical protein [Nocardioides marinus]
MAGGSDRLGDPIRARQRRRAAGLPAAAALHCKVLAQSGLSGAGKDWVADV